MLFAPPAALAHANPVARENARPGTTGWIVPPAPASLIEGYASETSLLPGETLHLHVSTDARYRALVFRLGWYGGAGARLVACSPADCISTRSASRLPVPPPDPITGEVAAGWPITDAIELPSSALSGYYVARLVLANDPLAGYAASVPFLVRPPPQQRSAVLVQVPVNTWEAYNGWGGKSLYNFNSTDGIPANHVSFDRPYGVGAQGPFEYELQLVRFLEREGVDVSYQTDVDTHRNTDSLLEHRLVMTAGHGEYWTKQIRDGFDAARDLGTNLAFMGSNTGYWQVRYEDGERTVVGYKSAADPIADPLLKTILFRALDPPRYECELEGVQHTRLRDHQTGQVDYTVTSAAATDPWFANTGFHPGDVIKDGVGNEWDGIPEWLPPECNKPGLVVLFHYEGPPQNADAVRYTAPSGARVFASGAQQFSWGLDTFDTRRFGHSTPADPRLQQFMRNALDDLLRPASPQGYRLRVGHRSVHIHYTPPQDPRIRGILVFRHDGSSAFIPGTPEVVQVCFSTYGRCRDKVTLDGRTVRYAAVTVDEWGESAPLVTEPLRLVPGTRLSAP